MVLSLQPGHGGVVPGGGAQYGGADQHHSELDQGGDVDFSMDCEDSGKLILKPGLATA